MTDDATLPETAHAHSVRRWQHGEPTSAQDMLANEVPVALVFNGISHVVMLATPADLEDFAYGFALTEGIISDASQYYGITLHATGSECQVDQAVTQGNQDDALQVGIEVHIELASAAFAGLKAMRRNLIGRTGCGLCGAESLQQVFKQPSHKVTPAELPLTQVALSRALAALPSQQPLQQMTGASHACALVNMQGEIVLVREDVGRHNALDKLLGALMRQGRLHELSSGWILTTSRASYELVQKVAMAGGHALIAMSAPTALAVQLAKSHHITLIGFARSGQSVVYHGSLS